MVCGAGLRAHEARQAPLLRARDEPDDELATRMICIFNCASGVGVSSGNKTVKSRRASSEN